MSRFKQEYVGCEPHEGFADCVLGAAGSNCACADTDASGQIDAADVPGFVQLLLGT
jgi:hypothetical protein